ncbi:MAG TPA: gluconeogenesis factor YvcK family protein, partial [Armatimonadota bacterium]|nr:gluconeogenesis factor YvcK family protein [Armatimonadota bacterium]
LLAALADITGSFETAVRETGNILAIQGRVLPLSLERIDLRASMADGACVEGESEITAYPARIHRLQLSPPDPEPLPEALQAIEQAEVVVIGPGSLYTSVLPTLLPSAVREALARSTGTKVYVCNVMTQPGETDDYTAADHVRTLYEHGAGECFDFVLINNEEPPVDAQERYLLQGAAPVLPDLDEVAALGYSPVAAPLLQRDHFVRHNPRKLARALLTIWSGSLADPA